MTTLRVGMRSSAVKHLQQELAKVGAFKGPTTGYYGPITQAAVKAFERSHRLHVDGIADPVMQASVARAAAAHKPKPVAAPASWKTVKAPPNDYRVVTFRGVKVNVRTRVMIQRAESYLRKLGVPGTLSFSQGSYHPGVGASAGTHDKGGALDIRINRYSTRTADQVVKAMRMAGFAAWRRGVNGDGFPPHIHAIAIGDKKAAPLAKRQVVSYFNGRDGLKGNRRDIHLTAQGHNVGRPVPNWAR
jgi:peptidoglycan hydrolase-like protein with peptidoglycan-binding domain